MTAEPNEPAAPACFDCVGRANERLTEMFVDIVQARRISLGQSPAERPVFRKLHGAAHGELIIRDDLPADWRIGVFSHIRMPAWVRFSSDVSPTSPDLNSTLGIGIKLFGMPGRSLLGDGRTVDFIMQNHPVFFVDNAAEMCEFTYAGVVAGDYPAYLARHPATARILREMSHVEGSVLSAAYWSIVPFKFGPEQYVKYKLEPLTQRADIGSDDPNYLAVDLATRLRAGDARFRLLAQFRTNPERMPLDEATIEWTSPFNELATLVLAKQDVHARGQAEYGQNLAFNIWRVPPDQEPQGSIAAARRDAYAASAMARHDANGLIVSEPSTPRASSPPVDDRDDCIVQAVIHPSIGIARVGGSPDEWFIGPEVTRPKPLPPGSYRDRNGALKRQAARFRVYGVNAAGAIVKELTPADASIRWTVHLANQKAAWYGFQLALDIPEASSAPATLLRNAGVADRSQLVIDPGPRTIEGCSTGPDGHRFDSGQFMNAPVYLGELRTDEDGRLIVLGGHGDSASHDGARAVTFANNDGWHDDVSDGPVTAEVEYGGQRLAVTSSWVVVAPPNYAPAQKSVRTMWDLMRDVAIQAGMLAAPGTLSFTQDIAPIFERLSHLQWVNAGFAAAFGWNGPFDLSSPAQLQRLSDNAGASQEMRRVLYNQFRDGTVDAWSPVPWPWLYGDAMSIPPAPTPRQNSTLSTTQMQILQAWVRGDFEADYDPDHEPPRRIDDVPVAEQGQMLDRAALEFCLADAFHPGCEMTWPTRAATMYMAPFRFLHARTGWIEPDYGEQLTGDNVTIPDGPLYGQLPGGVTRWMAVPWQTDTASCRSGYDKTYEPYVPTFWPARVPNHVLSNHDYGVVMDTGRPLDERLAAFAHRAAWIAPLDVTATYTQQINTMIAHFDRLGIVEVRDGPDDAESFPNVMQVQDERHPPTEVEAGDRLTGMLHTQGGTLRPSSEGERAETDLSSIDKVRRFPSGLRHSP